jgi:hypothetical protein
MASDNQTYWNVGMQLYYECIFIRKCDGSCRHACTFNGRKYDQHFTTLQEIDILAHLYTLHCLCLSWACICWLDEHIHVLRCLRKCDGSCRHACTFNGRKYDSIAGLSNRWSVVLDDNVLCS